MIVHVLRKPLIGTVAANALAHGAGALNIDGCRIGSESRTNPAAGNKGGSASYNMGVYGMPAGIDARECTGRWPANLVHDGDASGSDKSFGSASRFFQQVVLPR